MSVKNQHSRMRRGTGEPSCIQWASRHRLHEHNTRRAVVKGQLQSVAGKGELLLKVLVTIHKCGGQHLVITREKVAGADLQPECRLTTNALGHTCWVDWGFASRHKRKGIQHTCCLRPGYLCLFNTGQLASLPPHKVLHRGFPYVAQL